MLKAAAQEPTFLLARQTPAQRLVVMSLALAALLALAVVIAVGSGSSRIPYEDVVHILLGAQDASIPDSQITIVQQVRLPRVIAAVFIGAALAVSGAVMQGIFRNPLAESGILGVTVGGSLGAVFAFSTGLALAGLWVVPIFAFTGSPVSFDVARQYAAAKREGAKWPLRWTSITASHSASSMLKLILSRRMPALLMSTSRRPNVSTACWTSASAPFQDETLS